MCMHADLFDSGTEYLQYGFMRVDHPWLTALKEVMTPAVITRWLIFSM